MTEIAKRPSGESARASVRTAGSAAARIDEDSLLRSVRAPEAEAVLAQMVDGLREHLVRTDLVQGRTQQVGARLPENLVAEAKRRTGLVSNTDLLVFALANVAIDDNFADAFERAHGKLDPGLDVGLQG